MHSFIMVSLAQQSSRLSDAFTFGFIMVKDQVYTYYKSKFIQTFQCSYQRQFNANLARKLL